MCDSTKEIKNLRFAKNFNKKEIEILETIHNFFLNDKTNSIECEEEIFNILKSMATLEGDLDSVIEKLNLNILFIEDIFFYIENELKLNSKINKHNSNVGINFIDFEKQSYIKLPRINSKQNKALQDIWNIHFAHKKESTN